MNWLQFEDDIRKLVAVLVEQYPVEVLPIVISQEVARIIDQKFAILNGG